MSGRPGKQPEMVTSEECIGAFAAPDVFKSTKEITRNVNLRRESEQQTTPKAVECRLQVMASVKPPLVKVKQEGGEKLYALVGSEQESSPESPVPFPNPEPAPSLPRKTAEGDSDMPVKPENDSNEQSDVRPPLEQKPKKLTPTEREEQFRERMLGLLGNKTNVLGDIAGKLQETQESFQKTIEALRGMEREKMATQEERIQELEKLLQERDRKIAALEQAVSESKVRAGGLSQKAAELDKLRDVWRDVTPDNLRRLRENSEKRGGWFGNLVVTITPLATLVAVLVVLFFGWKSIQQVQQAVQQATQPAVEIAAPSAAEREVSGEDKDLDEYIRKLESETE